MTAVLFPEPHAQATFSVERASHLPADWDSFAQRCEATYLGARGYLLSLRLTHRLAVFQFFAGATEVGQCTAAIPRTGAGVRRIVDVIQILPDHRGYWAEMMQIVLRSLGRGTYRYGSAWSVYAPCEVVLAALPGVRITAVEPYNTQAVDASAWTDFETYRKAMSTNAKRNVAKALKVDPAVHIVTTTGWGTLQDNAIMLWLRRKTYQRKGAHFNFLRASARALGRAAMLAEYTFVSRVVFKGATVAYLSGVRFGPHIYYIDGASHPDNGGAAWFLLTETVRDMFSQMPNGKFIMGADRPDNGRWEGWDNVLRQREQCRVAHFPTAVLTFE
jgi:hypothetical protein